MACASRDGRCFCAATRVDGHLTPIAQQHKPTWQQTSLSTKDSPVRNCGDFRNRPLDLAWRIPDSKF